MVSVASSSATMDLTAILPALMEGIAQEVGVDMGDIKVILVGEETQLDVKPFQTLKEQYHMVEWDYKRLDQLRNPEPCVEIQPYVEIRLKQDAPLLQSYNTSQTQLAFDVKGSERWTHGDRPVDLYQVGSYGSCLSALRSKLIWAMEGVFTSKGAVKMGAVKSFQGGVTSIRKSQPSLRNHPCRLIASFTSRLGTPSILLADRHALEFNVSFAGVSSIAFNVSTLCQHRWNTNANWSQSIADVDLLRMYDKRKDTEATLQAMGLDHTRLPVACDPGYRYTLPSDEEIIAKAPADRMCALMAGDVPRRYGLQDI